MKNFKKQIQENASIYNSESWIRLSDRQQINAFKKTNNIFKNGIAKNGLTVVYQGNTISFDPFKIKSMPIRFDDSLNEVPKKSYGAESVLCAIGGYDFIKFLFSMIVDCYAQIKYGAPYVMNGGFKNRKQNFNPKGSF